MSSKARIRRRAQDAFAIIDDEKEAFPAGQFDPAENYEYETIIEDEDDEEIDEDEAFNEEDDETYGHLFENNKKSRVVLFEDEQTDDEEEDDEEVEISNLLDDENTDKVVEFIQELGNEKKLKSILKKTVKNEAYEESEFNIRDEDDEDIELLDMLASVKDVKSFGNIKRTLEDLEASKSNKKVKGIKTATLSKPLHARALDRINREAAYDQSKKEISFWQPIVKKNREADHLVFPLNKADNRSASNSAALVTKFKPSNDMEEGISSILEKSGMNEEQLNKSEELKLKELSVEEVKERRAELAKLRSLMFFEEQKLKRISKIKSKEYRKRNKNKKDDDEEGDEVNRERERAQERMTLRHKNTGKWAKRMLSQNDQSVSREQIADQLKRADYLTRKITGNEDSDDEVEKENLETIKESVQATQLPEKGLFAMKFMKDAFKRQQEKVLAALEENVEQEAEAALSEESEVEELNDKENHKPAREKKNFEFYSGYLGHKAGKSSSHSTKLSGPVSIIEASHVDPQLDIFNKSNEKEFISYRKQESNIIAAEIQEPIDETNFEQTEFEEIEENPWLSNLDAPVRKTAEKYKRNECIEEDKEKVVIRNQITFDDVNDEENLMSKQRDLIKEVFANDHLVVEFEKEKEELIDMERSKEVDVTLPGWGHWAGNGLKDTKKRVIEKVKGIEPFKRKDAKLKHVIINEKRIKSADKFVVDKIPFPYSSKEQYERSLQLPIGKEWNSAVTHQKLIKPRIITRPGSIIAPIKIQSIGIAGLQRQKQANEQYREIGSNLASENLAKLLAQMETFKASLEEFAVKHRKEIIKDPVFRNHFHKMCQKIGVDPLVSTKGFWAEILGVGDFYYELAVQIVEICLKSREINGGLMEMEILLAELRKKRASTAQEVSEDDVVRSIKSLKKLGGGYELIKIGSKSIIQSVPRELNLDTINALSVIQKNGYFTIHLLEKELSWPEIRCQNSIDLLIQEGIIWIDSQADPVQYFSPKDFS